MYTECVVNGVTQETTWITDHILECKFEPQDFRPFAYAGDRLSVRLKEHGLYLNSEMSLLLLNQPYVYKVEP